MGQIQVKKITIHNGEGLIPFARIVANFNNFVEAEEYLQERAKRMPMDGGYYKHSVVVEYEDGEIFKTRQDIRNTDQYFNNNISRNLKTELNFLLKAPSHMTKEVHAKYLKDIGVTQKDIDNAKEMLNGGRDLGAYSFTDEGKCNCSYIIKDMAVVGEGENQRFYLKVDTAIGNPLYFCVTKNKVDVIDKAKFNVGREHENLANKISEYPDWIKEKVFSYMKPEDFSLNVPYQFMPQGSKKYSDFNNLSHPYSPDPTKNLETEKYLQVVYDNCKKWAERFLVEEWAKEKGKDVSEIKDSDVKSIEHYLNEHKHMTTIKVFNNIAPKTINAISHINCDIMEEVQKEIAEKKEINNSASFQCS